MTNKNFINKTIIMSCIGSFLFSISMTFSKLIDPNVNSFVIIFSRSFFGLIISSIFLYKNLITKKRLYNENLIPYFFRNSLLVLTMFCTYSGYRNLPLKLASSLGLLGPFFTFFLSLYFFKKEQLTFSKVAGLIFGYLGVILLINPFSQNNEFNNYYLIFPFLANLFAAFIGIITKKMIVKTNKYVLMFFNNLTLMIFSGLVIGIKELMYMQFFNKASEFIFHIEVFVFFIFLFLLYKYSNKLIIWLYMFLSFITLLFIMRDDLLHFTFYDVMYFFVIIFYCLFILLIFAIFICLIISHNKHKKIDVFNLFLLYFIPLFIFYIMFFVFLILKEKNSVFLDKNMLFLLTISLFGVFSQLLNLNVIQRTTSPGSLSVIEYIRPVIMTFIGIAVFKENFPSNYQVIGIFIIMFSTFLFNRRNKNIN